MKPRYEQLIADIPDHPKPGILFRDITPVFGDAEALRETIDKMAEHYMGRGITKVMGAEARGFIIAAPLAYTLGAGFVPARKPGKLPRETITCSYELEYGTDTLQIHADSLVEGDNVLIVDDLLATGGTADAMLELASQTPARIAGAGFFLELTELGARKGLEDRLAACPSCTCPEVFSLVKV